ncbi:hypothetical protein TNCV_2426451 [Trichonephila clavipes]|nr:hypothetical protein TNCV_2426451 [Trichonephila clavipes]
MAQQLMRTKAYCAHLSIRDLGHLGTWADIPVRLVDAPCCWPGGSFAVRNCWEQWTREGTHSRKTGSGVTRKTTRREDRAASTCGPHSDSFNDTSRRKRSNCSTNNFQTPSRSKS